MLTPREIKKKLKEAFEKQVRTAFMIEGDMGIGKTTIPRELAMEFHVPVVITHPAQEPAEDVVGIPDLSQGGTVLRYRMPGFTEVMTKSPRGIWIIDEINHAVKETVDCFFSVVEESKRTLRDFQIPPGWLIVLTGNPDDGFYHVNPLSPAFKRRPGWLTMEFSPKDFSDYAAKSGFHEVITDFSRIHPELIWMDPKKVETGVPANPAGYETISDWLKADFVTLDNPSAVDVELIAGKIGNVATASLISFAKDKHQRFVTARDLFEGKDDEFKKHFKELLSTQEKNDRITASIHDIVAYIRGRALKADKKFDTAVTRCAEIITSKDFRDLNRTLLVSELVTGGDAEEEKIATAVATPFAKVPGLLKIIQDVVSSTRARVKA